MQSCTSLDLEGSVRHHEDEDMNGKVVLGTADLFGSNEEDEEEVLKRQIEDIQYVRSVLQDESTLFSRMVNVYGNIVDSLLKESIMQARCCVSGQENGTKQVGATRCAEIKSIRRVGNASNARAGGGTKHDVDVFGQDVSGASVEPVECRHCGRRVSANRFVPHLEKCSGREVFGAEYGTKRRQSRRGRYS